MLEMINRIQNKVTIKINVMNVINVINYRWNIKIHIKINVIKARNF